MSLTTLTETPTNAASWACEMSITQGLKTQLISLARLITGELADGLVNCLIAKNRHAAKSCDVSEFY
jgi:hypothetical protein